MSFQFSDVASDIRTELNVSDTILENSDLMLFMNNVNEQYGTEYQMPTREKESNFVVYPGVFEYPLPSDLNYIIQPRRPYPLRDSPVFQHKSAKEFATWYQNRKTAMKFDRANRYLLVDTVDGTETTLQACESTTDNGTVAVSGDGSNLISNAIIFQRGNASLQFTVTASGGTTTLTFTNFSQVDISNLMTYGWFFVELECPSTNTVDLTSAVLRLGNDASNYYSFSATTRFRGDGIGPGWGVIGYDPSTKSTTGTVTETQIDYAQIILTTGLTGVDGTYRANGIFGSTGTYYLLPYYSKYNIQTSSGTYKEKITLDSDTVLCPPTFDNVYKYQVMEIAAAQRLKDAGLASYARDKGVLFVNAMKAEYPKQTQLVQSSWYRDGRRRTTSAVNNWNW